MEQLLEMFIHHSYIKIRLMLGSFDQRQVTIENTECNMFNYSVYSNKSHDLLFLTTQETPIRKSAKD